MAAADPGTFGGGSSGGWGLALRRAPGPQERLAPSPAALCFPCSKALPKDSRFQLLQGCSLSSGVNWPWGWRPMELVVSVILCTAPRPCGFREGWDCEAGGRDAGRCKWLCLSEQSWSGSPRLLPPRSSGGTFPNGSYVRQNLEIASVPFQHVIPGCGVFTEALEALLAVALFLVRTAAQ